MIANKEEIALMAHLMRRAGFGASREELEARVEKGYEATVEELLHPEEQEPVDEYDLLRYHIYLYKPRTGNPPVGGPGVANWMYFLINTKAPLQEKIALFWHQIFATGVAKVNNYDEVTNMIRMFREKGLGSYREILLEVAKNPAMIYWLDNNENHAYAVNENWGRELLELFSMGVGTYTEADVREVSRAFTGWTIAPTIPNAPYGRYDWYFEYRAEDHDDGEKTFLGHTGTFNGEDVIDIICEQPATARFICRHLYNFFVADEVQVPSWSVTPPRDPEAIETLMKVFEESKRDMRSVLWVLFNSDFFKEARFSKIKSPAEVVISMVRLMGGDGFPYVGFTDLSRQPAILGQDLLDPPSVEGWHTGHEWVNSGTLMKRVNFCSDMVGDLTRPGVRAIIDRVKAQGDLSPEELVDTCLDLMGPLEVTPKSKQELVSHASKDGGLRWGTEEESSSPEQRVAGMLQMIVALREYQYA